jgi:putative oxidoreductase
MNVLALYHQASDLSARVLRPLEPLLALATRVYVGWQFVKSGWLKLTSWDGTLYLFREEYRVPLLPPEIAAVSGTASELLFGALVIFGLAGRASAAGLFAVNALAVVSYSHVLLAAGFEAALAQHVLWGFMLAMLIVYGPGRWSIDGLVDRLRGSPNGTLRV